MSSAKTKEKSSLTAICPYHPPDPVPQPPSFWISVVRWTGSCPNPPEGGAVL
jgi:hypothetical protein